MRKRAATVPASKAEIDTIYAVMRKNELTRFRVTKITTHRIDNTGSPHDYISEITGDFILSNDPVNGYKTEKATIKPSDLLGQFEQYQELVAKKEAENKIIKEKTAAEKKAAEELAALLYDISGLPIPNDRYRQSFEVKYDTGVEISRDAVKALLPKLLELMKTR